MALRRGCSGGGLRVLWTLGRQRARSGHGGSYAESPWAGQVPPLSVKGRRGRCLGEGGKSALRGERDKTAPWSEKGRTAPRGVGGKENAPWGEEGQRAPWGEGGKQSDIWGEGGKQSAPWGKGGKQNAPWGEGGKQNAPWGEGGKQSAIWGEGGKQSAPWGEGGKQSAIWGEGGKQSAPWGEGGKQSAIWGEGGKQSAIWGEGGKQNAPWGEGGKQSAPWGEGGKQSAPWGERPKNAPWGEGGKQSALWHQWCKETVSKSHALTDHDLCCQRIEETSPMRLGNERTGPRNLSKQSIPWSLGSKEYVSGSLRSKDIPLWDLRFKACTLRNRVYEETAPLYHAERKSPLWSQTLKHLFKAPLEGEGERGSDHRRNRTFLLGILAAFSFFSKSDDQEEGKKGELSDQEEGKKGELSDQEEGKKDEISDQEDKIIYLLKKAKLSIMKGELEDAERILHQAARLSHESDNKKAVIYTYDLMANLAFLRGQFSSAEKLFKVVMSELLAAGTSQEDNAFIEISLKLASIYAARNQHELAKAGYEFCILTLEEKLEKQKDVPEEVLTEEEKANTGLLLGLCMDSYARYLLANKQLPLARSMCEKALKISTEVQGEMHPQTVVLMSDLAAVLDSQGQHDEAYKYVKRASELAKQTEHPEEHVVLNNLAGILMHQEHFDQAAAVFKLALKQAERKGDTASIQHIKEGLAELSRRKGGP